MYNKDSMGQNSLTPRSRDKMGRSSKYSYKSIIRFGTVIMIGICILIMTTVAVYSVYESRKNTREKLRYSLNKNVAQFQDNVSDIDTLLTEFCYYTSDFYEIIQSRDIEDAAPSVTRLRRNLCGVVPSVNTAESIFIYFGTIDVFLSAGSSQNSQILGNAIRESIRGSLENGTEISEQTSDWKLCELEGQLCAVKIQTQIGNSLIGAFYTIEDAARQIAGSASEQYEYLIADGEQVIYQTIDLEKEDLLSGKKMGKIRTEKGEFYYFDALEYEGNTRHLFLLFPLDENGFDAKPIIALMTLLGGFSIFFAVAFFLFLNKTIQIPFQTLADVNQQITTVEGIPKLVIPEVRCIEIQQSLDLAAHLCDMSLHLQKMYLEEHVSRTKTELNRLKSQVAPHFLINCLYTLQSLVDSGHADSEIFSNLIRTLSEHLRYSLSDDERVSLREELYYVENYIKLSQIRYPFSLEYRITAKEDALKAEVITLLILTLTENSIKHNLVMGKKLIITIDCEVREGILHIRHADNGQGFPQWFLQSVDGSKVEEGHNGKRIGLHNVVKRLELSVPDSSIRFNNSEGAVVEITVPYIETDGNGNDESVDCR